ncbi:MAG: response regulator [Deltaproteobacteria bacterium]|nr:response regulator [Deltaproteobacteria bacterium]
MAIPSHGSEACRAVIVVGDDRRAVVRVQGAVDLPVHAVADERATRQLLERDALALVVLEISGSYDGLALARTLRQNYPSLRLVYLTRDSSLRNRLAALELGCQDYISRRVPSAELRARLSWSLRAPPLRPLSTLAPLRTALERIERDRLGGVLRLSDHQEAAEIIFKAGCFDTASFGRLRGEPAFNAALRQPRWQVDYTADAPAASLAQASTLPGVTAPLPLPALDSIPSLDFEDQAETIFDPQPAALAEPRAESLARELETSDIDDDDAEETTERGELAPRGSVQPPGELVDEADAAPFVEDSPTVERAPSVARRHSPPVPAYGPAVVLVIDPAAALNETLTAVLAAAGWRLVSEPSLERALRVARDRRPDMIVVERAADRGAPAGLLAALRSDFLVRETPLLLLENGGLMRARQLGSAQALAAGIAQAAAEPRALSTALADPQIAQLAGSVDTLGTATILRKLAACSFTGRLELRSTQGHNAEVVCLDGALCDATVTAPDPSVGALAMFNLLGYQWDSYRIYREAGIGAVPLGPLDEQVERACDWNNLLLRRVFDQGTAFDDLYLDRTALDAYLRIVPQDALPLVMRMTSGVAPRQLVAEGTDLGAMRLMLCDLRRKSVIRLRSLRSLPTTRTDTRAALSQQTAVIGRRRWWVIGVAAAATVVVAGISYLIVIFVAHAP